MDLIYSELRSQVVYPILFMIITTVFSIAGVQLNKYLKKLETATGIQIDTEWRNKLHLALETHVKAIALAYADKGMDFIQDKVREKLPDLLRQSNAGTLEHFPELISSEAAELAMQYVPKAITAVKEAKTATLLANARQASTPFKPG